MARTLLFNKPFDVLSQFTDTKSPTKRRTLSDFIDVPKRTRTCKRYAMG